MQAVAAHFLPIPEIYSKQTALILTAKKSAFDRFPKAGDWNDVHESRFSQIATQIEVTFRDHINNRWKPDNQCNILCQMALKTVVSALTRFHTFLSSQFRIFKGQAMSDDDSWALTTRLGKMILCEIHRAHGAAHTQYEYGNIQRVAAMHLYWTCKSLDKLDEYVTANFVEHPSINNTVIQYFLESVGGKHDDNAFEQKVKDMKKKLDEHTKSIQTIGNRADKAVTQDELKKATNKCITDAALNTALKKYQLKE